MVMAIQDPWGNCPSDTPEPSPLLPMTAIWGSVGTQWCDGNAAKGSPEYSTATQRRKPDIVFNGILQENGDPGIRNVSLAKYKQQGEL